MKLVWTSDIHLDHVRHTDRRKAFYERVKRAGDAVIITGDIASGTNFDTFLLEMNDHINKPINFVLGNHDFYHSSVHKSEDKAHELSKDDNNKLIYLPNSFIDITDDICLIGINGWADARHGDFDHSPVSLNDQWLISELLTAAVLNRSEMRAKMQAFADADALLLRSKITEAIRTNHKKIIIATHIPPYADNAMYEGKISSDDFLPFYTSKAIGDVLTETACVHSDLEIIVLCGHSHHIAINHEQANLLVYTANAEYGWPEIAGIINLDNFEMEYIA